MKAIIALVVVLGCVSCAFADDVLDLDENNFDEVIKTNNLVLVEFFAPWCGHCKSLAPEYTKAAADLKGKGYGALAKVDCTKEDDVCKRFGIRGFPTIKLFRGDPAKPFADYDGARKADALVRFMAKQSTPAVETLKDASDVNKFFGTDSVTVVAFLRSDEHVQTFTNVANSLRNDFRFGAVVNNAEAETAFDVTAPAVVVHRSFDAGNAIKFTEPFGADVEAKITKFVRVNSLPALGTIGPENYQQYLERGFSLFWIFYNPSDAAQETLLQEVVQPVANEFYDRLSFVKLDGMRWAEHAKSLGLSGSTPGIVIQDHAKNKNFVLDEQQPVTVEALRAHVEGFLAGTLAQTVRSQPIPESNDGPVKVVVGKTFKDITFDEKKNVLIEFYAPWCGHCTALAPKYEELGKLFADDANVVIAKMDATVNDAPGGPKIEGFPTLMFYPASTEGKQNPIPLALTQGMTANDMAKFVRENSVKPATGGAAAAGHEEL